MLNESVLQHLCCGWIRSANNTAPAVSCIEQIGVIEIFRSTDQVVFSLNVPYSCGGSVLIEASTCSHDT